MQRPWPLFLRIFTLMLGTVMLVQVLNFAVVLLIPPPMPVIFTASRVAAVARTGHDPGGLLKAEISTGPPRPTDNPRDGRLAASIATDLGLPLAKVTVETERSAMPLFAGALRPPLPIGIARRPGLPPSFDNALFGPFVVSIEAPDGRWLVIRPTRSTIGPWRMRIILWFLVAMAVAAPIAWASARRAAKPIGLFAAAAERLGRDPRAEPLRVTGPPEIAEAASAFNLMQERLNRYVEDRTTLIAAVAHDLRTPLMRLSLRLEKAPDDIRASSEIDIQEMSQRIGSAMAFVRDMTRHVRRQRLDLRSLAESVTDEFSDRGDSVVLHPGAALTMEGDAPSLKAVLANLVGNAVKYAGHADVRLRRDGGLAIIEVSDTGPGMAPQDLARAFEPFFRAEHSRNRDTGGSGLGLASVRAVARGHGGDATIANRPGGGLVAVVTLPV
ncbi:HAMP domain-containing histidine kinase [Sphingomonas sp. UV9]|uniref:sensor histidine kinase n=1 Tax=Sphingomonas sp. UV9 TaxID=1851410 RepID=UPI000FFC987D|nr:HAMP domain-containing sensor histidine kinase [Sphingomonas sp. UV9]RXD05349.1 HAMP domain-containing histidine kinase [Sphingomonas sp. UV9]